MTDRLHITGCHIQSGDGEIGHVEDFLGDDAGWSSRFTKIDTGNGWPRRGGLGRTAFDRWGGA
jgi:hypothetical protein